MSKKNVSIKSVTSEDITVKGDKPTKVYISLDEVKTVENALRNLEEKTEALPESTFKRSFITHFKYMNKNIITRKNAAETKALIRGIREGKVDVSSLHVKEE